MDTQYLQLSYDQCAYKVKEIVLSLPIQDRNRHNALSSYWIVFDVDHTLLTDDKYRRYYKTKSDVFKYMYRGDFDPIIPMVDLCNWCSEQGINICIITGRKEGMRSITQSNLIKAGIKKCHRLYMRKDTRDTRQYKSSCRKGIIDEGYTIIANIGDQEDDLLIDDTTYGYSKYAIKLPSNY